MLFETSVLAAFGAMFAWGIGDFFIQKTTRAIGSVQALAYIGIIGLVLLFPMALPELGLFFSYSNLPLLLALGIITFFATVVYFEALKEGKLSVVEVVLSVELPITVFLAIVFFKETLSLMQIGLIFLLFFGVILTSIATFSKSFIKNLEKGFLLALIAAILMGAVDFLTAISSKTISPLAAIWFPWLVFTIISIVFLFHKKELNLFFKNGIKYKKMIIAMGIIDTMAWLFFAIAVVDNLLSVTIAITQAYPAVAMALGIVINKEKLKNHQYIGGILSLACSFALALLQ